MIKTVSENDYIHQVSFVCNDMPRVQLFNRLINFRHTGTRLAPKTKPFRSMYMGMGRPEQAARRSLNRPRQNPFNL